MEEVTERWAFSEFGLAALGNQLRTKRLVSMAETVMTTPSGKITEVFRDPAEREAAFRFVESDHVEEAALKAAAHDAGARRCTDATFAYVAVDKSSLTLPGRPGSTDFGMVGTSKVAVHGVLVMSALAMTPDGVPQGLVAQEYWTRPVRKRAPRNARRRVPPLENETKHWLAAMASTVSHFAAQAPACRPWFQIDREGDATAILMWAVEHSQWLTVRATHDRRVGFASVAARLLRMSYLARTSPATPASNEFSPAEIRAVLVLKKPKAVPAHLTIGQLVRWIAELGGYTSYASSGGPPGALVLARGFKDVLVAVRTIEALAET